MNIGHVLNCYLSCFENISLPCQNMLLYYCKGNFTPITPLTKTKAYESFLGCLSNTWELSGRQTLNSIARDMVLKVIWQKFSETAELVL